MRARECQAHSTGLDPVSRVQGMLRVAVNARRKPLRTDVTACGGTPTWHVLRDVAVPHLEEAPDERPCVCPESTEPAAPPSRTGQRCLPQYPVLVRPSRERRDQAR